MQDGDRLSPLLDYSSASNRPSRRSQGASSPATVGMKYIDNEEDDIDDDSPTLSEKDGTLYNKDGTRVEPDLPMDATKMEDEDKIPNEALKNNPLLTPVISLLLHTLKYCSIITSMY